MRYDPTQPITDISSQDNNIPKPHGINLDLSSRKRIVIQASASRKENVLARPPTIAIKTFAHGSSIFNRVQSRIKETSDASAQFPKPIQTESVMESSSQCVASLAPPGFEQTHEANVMKTKQQTMTEGPDTGLITTDFAGDPTRMRDVFLGEDMHPLYSREYNTCGCSMDAKPTCSRCQLLLLTERFCQTIDRQHRKWNLLEK